jgi:hypothetical protein
MEEEKRKGKKGKRGGEEGRRINEGRGEWEKRRRET